MRYYCKRCGYMLPAPTSDRKDCIWCSSDVDTLETLNTGDIVRLNNRYNKLSRQQQVNYVIGLGLEGFTINEIATITGGTQKNIGIILQYAEICKAKK